MRSVEELKSLQEQISDDERVDLVEIKENGEIETLAYFKKGDELSEIKEGCIKVNERFLLVLSYADAIIISKRKLHLQEKQATLKRWMK